MATKTKAKTKVKAMVTVAKFTDTRQPFTLVRECSPLGEFAPVHEGDYLATGWDTPLRDATAKFIGYLDGLRKPDEVLIGAMVDESGSMAGNEPGVIAGLNEFVESMRAVKKVDPKSAGKVLCVIVTDGLENKSREVSADGLRAMLKAREADGWTFIYLGANQDAWSAGMGYGFSGGATGQTVSMRSSSPQAFRSALRRTGVSHGAGYVGDHGTYMASASAMSSRTISEDGEETVNAPDLQGSGVVFPEPTPEPETFGDVQAAQKRAIESLRGEGE